MGNQIKIQRVERGSTKSYYVNFPATLAEATRIEKGEEMEWFLEDRDTFVLKRKKSSRPLLKRKKPLSWRVCPSGPVRQTSQTIYALLALRRHPSQTQGKPAVYHLRTDVLRQGLWLRFFSPLNHAHPSHRTPVSRRRPLPLHRTQAPWLRGSVWNPASVKPCSCWFLCSMIRTTLYGGAQTICRAASSDQSTALLRKGPRSTWTAGGAGLIRVSSAQFHYVMLHCITLHCITLHWRFRLYCRASWFVKS